MRPKLHILVTDTGIPYASVPCQLTWDLVEYLSFHRAAVYYRFLQTHFEVAFLKQTSASAQEFLDQWSQGSTEYEVAEAQSGGCKS